MTGFARATGIVNGLEVTVVVKSVNHRGLDLHFYTGPEIDAFESTLRAAIKRRVARGHLDVRVQVCRPAGQGALEADQSKLDAYVELVRQSAARLQLICEPDLNTALRLPGMLRDNGGPELGEAFGAELTALTERVLDELNVFREREGGELARWMLERSDAILRIADQISMHRQDATRAFQERLQDRLKELLGAVAMEPQRLIQEAALLADRSDIAEEIERLRIHARQAGEILNGGGEAGKRLDFLLQEMNRETNTILSKTSGLGAAGLEITALALEAKSEIEKLREQALNLE
jgi:uncharacterized protein (TIGR00255 family)